MLYNRELVKYWKIGVLDNNGFNFLQYIIMCFVFAV